MKIVREHINFDRDEDMRDSLNVSHNLEDKVSTRVIKEILREIDPYIEWSGGRLENTIMSTDQRFTWEVNFGSKRFDFLLNTTSGLLHADEIKDGEHGAYFDDEEEDEDVSIILRTNVKSIEGLTNELRKFFEDVEYS